MKPTTITATIRATPEQLAVIDAAAARAGMSRAAYIIRAAVTAANTNEHNPNTVENTTTNTTEHNPNTAANTIEHITAELAELRQRVELLEKRKPAPALTRTANTTEHNPNTSTNTTGGRYDESAVLSLIERMRIAQTADGFKPDNKAIAAALNEAGLLQSNGNAWNHDRVNTVITRKLPHLKGK